jgi:hypothetical protein
VKISAKPLNEALSRWPNSDNLLSHYHCFSSHLLVWQL